LITSCLHRAWEVEGNTFLALSKVTGHGMETLKFTADGHLIHDHFDFDTY